MASSSSSSSSSSTTPKANKYDVFLSFRGEDTRKAFASVLHGVLQREGVNVFIDDDLKRGEKISPSLLAAIEESTISIIIFSQGYASSRWCLQELEKILKCKKNIKQSVIPVFYQVEPTHVRNQTGAFGDAFAELVANSEDKMQCDRWRNALIEAANISGRPLSGQLPDYALASVIVKDVLEILNYVSPIDNKALVGVETIINHTIKQLLQIHKSMIVCTLGIWGMGGIGKTAIAEAIFERIRTQFEDSYFAHNIREVSQSPNGLSHLREKLLSTILKDQYSSINSVFTKRRLCRKKVIIVFDDVTSFREIETLIGDLNCLGPGSRIIVTTRNKQVLKNCRVDEDMIYKMRGLSHFDAIWLFSWYAFRQNRPNMYYDELSNRVVKYARGVPLALKVLGSFLFDKPREVWESAISKLEIIPHEDIQKVLKVSYDGLDNSEKNIFLDIACFLKWEDKDFVIEFLNACGFFPESGISVLIDKCLITISIHNKITMHDLLQEMGWEIVRQESTRDPGERSRLWFHEDIYRVFEDYTGTKAIEGICLDMSKEREIIHLEPSTLSMMRELRFFKLHNSHYEENNINKVYASRDLNFVSTRLRYLCWYGCPLKSLQSNFHAKNLIALEMPHSNVEQLWTSVQLVKLKHIDLSYSKHLRKIEDLSLVPNLERLILEGCTSLLEISSSLQCFKKLIILNLKHCRSLHSLPILGIHFESLRKLILSFCSNLKTFPEISGNIEELYLDETAIEEMSSSIENLVKLVILNLKNCQMLESIPYNICKLTSLKHLNLSGCLKLDGLPDNLGDLEALEILKAEQVSKREVPSSIVHLRCLTKLNLSDCCIRELPENLGWLSSLESLLLSRNNFECVPRSITELSKLSYLDLSCCEMLQSLPKIPSQSRSLDAHGCISLKASSVLFLSALSQNARTNFSNCFKLDPNAVKEIVRDALHKIKSMRQDFRSRLGSSICYPGNEISELFIQNTGSTITVKLEAYHAAVHLSHFIVCAIVEFQNYQNDGQGFIIGSDWMLTSGDQVKGFQGTLRGWDCGAGPSYVETDHVFLRFIPLTFRTEQDKKTNITIRFYVENLKAESINCCIVKKCGVWNPYFDWVHKEVKLTVDRKRKLEEPF